MFILQSKISNRVILTIGQGKADLEINGETHHLGTPYLHVDYLPPGSSQERVFAGYKILGCIFSWNEQEITTPRLIAMLNFLGFNFDSENFRKKITDQTQSIIHLRKRLSLYSFDDALFNIPLALEAQKFQKMEKSKTAPPKKRNPLKKRVS